MWKKFPLTQDYDSEKIIGQITLDEEIVKKIQKEVPVFIKEQGIGMPLRLGYSGTLKEGSFTLEGFTLAK